MPASNRRQALLVPSATAIANPIGSAPGWWVDRDGGVVVLMPGVPSEMRKMWADEVRPRLEERFGVAPLRRRTVKSFGMGESAVAERLGALLSEPPAGVDAGIYARDDGVHVRFSSRDADAPLDALADRARGLLGEVAYGTDDDDLATAALGRLEAAGAATVASWEADSAGALIGVLSAAASSDGLARYVGGVLDAGTPSGPPIADAVIQLSLLPQDAHGRSRVRVAVSGAMTVPQTELRIHGSGPQRLRRAAFAALDLVRRSDPGEPSGR
jgi:nicotinamide-nucleotide amidase